MRFRTLPSHVKLLAVILAMIIMQCGAAQKSTTPPVKYVDGLLPDIADSTLLLYLYGSYSILDKEYIYLNGVMREPYTDSIEMHIRERLGDEEAQHIYIRGAVSHFGNSTQYNEVHLLVHRIEGGWHVVASEDAQDVQDQGLSEMIGVYNEKFFVLRSEWHHEINGGYTEDYATYYMLSRDSLGKCQGKVDLSVAASNEGSIDCSADAQDSCRCYGSQSESALRYVRALNCLAIDIHTTYKKYTCGRSSFVMIASHEIWYMNEDTAVLVSRDRYIDAASTALGKMKLSKAEITHIFKRKNQYNTGFKARS